MKKKINNEQFFSVFIGEVVSITTSTNLSQTVELEDEVVQIDIPNTFDGFLLDADEEYYYLGDTPHEVSKVVRKEQCVAIEIAKLKTKYDEILDEMDDVEDKDYN